MRRSRPWPGSWSHENVKVDTENTKVRSTQMSGRRSLSCAPQIYVDENGNVPTYCGDVSLVCFRVTAMTLGIAGGVCIVVGLLSILHIIGFIVFLVGVGLAGASCALCSCCVRRRPEPATTETTAIELAYTDPPPPPQLVTPEAKVS